jgi:hypothetical protein
VDIVSGDGFLPVAAGDDEVEETVNGATPAEAEVGEMNGLREESCGFGLVDGGEETEEKSNSNDFVGDETP